MEMLDKSHMPFWKWLVIFPFVMMAQILRDLGLWRQ